MALTSILDAFADLPAFRALTEELSRRDGLTIVTDESPEAFRKVVAADITKWAAVVKAAGIVPE